MNLTFVHSFLMLHVLPDDGLIQPPYSRSEEPRRPQHRPPVRPLQLGIPEPQLPSQIRFHLAHNTRDRILGGITSTMVNLHTPLLYLHIKMILLNLRQLLLQA